MPFQGRANFYQIVCQSGKITAMNGNAQLADLLRWQVDAGADEAIGEVSVDRYAAAPAAQPAQTASPAPAPAAVAPRRVAPAVTTPSPDHDMASREQVAQSAHDAARGADSLEALRDAFAGFDGCALKHTATSLVFGDGNPKASVMVVGEAPGAEEDRHGIPFVGPAGKLLDKMLAAIGLDRTGAYISNILPWRPPGNRSPTDAEIAACLPFIERHIELVAPQLLVLTGGTAAKTMLGAREGIMKLRGRWFTYESPAMASPIPARAILHPAFLLRTPAQKRATWGDLLAIRERLAGG